MHFQAFHTLSPNLGPLLERKFHLKINSFLLKPQQFYEIKYLNLTLLTTLLAFKGTSRVNKAIKVNIWATAFKCSAVKWRLQKRFLLVFMDKTQAAMCEVNFQGSRAFEAEEYSILQNGWNKEHFTTTFHSKNLYTLFRKEWKIAKIEGWFYKRHLTNICTLIHTIHYLEVFSKSWKSKEIFLNAI